MNSSAEKSERAMRTKLLLILRLSKRHQLIKQVAAMKLIRKPRQKRQHKSSGIATEVARTLGSRGHFIVRPPCR